MCYSYKPLVWYMLHATDELVIICCSHIPIAPLPLRALGFRAGASLLSAHMLVSGIRYFVMTSSHEG